MVDESADEALAAQGDALMQFVAAGGRIVSLPRSHAGSPSWAPDFDLHPAQIFGADCIIGGADAGTIRRDFGLGVGDFWWRQPFDLLVCAGPEAAQSVAPGLVTRLRVGEGEVCFCQVDPRVVAEWRAKPKPVRILSTLLTDAGARSRFEVSLEAPEWDLAARPWRFRSDPDEVGEAEGWADAELGDSGWRLLEAGTTWESQGVVEANPRRPGRPRTGYNGTAWYRTTVTVPEEARGRDIFLHLGGVAVNDWTYLNGRLLGSISTGTIERWNWPRRYRLDPDAINYGGANAIVIRVGDEEQRGGLVKRPFRLDYGDGPSPTALLPRMMPPSIYDPYRFHQY